MTILIEALITIIVILIGVCILRFLPSNNQHQQKASSASSKLYIYYATESGTSKNIAEDLSKAINQVKITQKQQITINIQDLSKTEIDDIAQINHAIFVVSTWENGSYPPSCSRFFKQLLDEAQDFRIPKSRLGALKFEIMCLGDQQLYPKTFCKIGKQLDKQLKTLGGNSYGPVFTIDCKKKVKQQVQKFVLKYANILFTGNTVLEKKREAKEKKETIIEEEDKLNDQIVDDQIDIEDSDKLLENRPMITERQRKVLTKQGYKLIGTHSAIKLCRWAKNMLKGRGACYKYTFYGIKSYQCMESTLSLACANRCEFCWRHHKNPVGTYWRWKTDSPEQIINDALIAHKGIIKELKGMTEMVPERYQEAMTPRHCALSLVGEAIMYPRVNEAVRLLHQNKISTFMVTNAQFPEEMRKLVPVTQFYVSIDAPNKEILKKIDRPLFKDFWERYIECLKVLRNRKERTVYRLTLVANWNVSDVEGYAELIEIGRPDFIELKSVTYSGTSENSKMTMNNVPWHQEIKNFGELLLSKLSCKEDYALASEHGHSCCMLIANLKYKINGKWNTWIDFDKFYELDDKYYETGELFNGTDYAREAPEWALYGSVEEGFNPEDKKFYSRGPSRGASKDASIINE